jgi:hypothetical protein
MWNAYHPKKVALNVNLSVITVAKCKQSSTLATIKNTISLLLYLLPKNQTMQKMVEINNK